MILRRFMQHVKEQNWFAVGLDVIVVIVGIFLGMQVQQWYEERQQTERIAAQLVSFRDELILSLDDLAESRTYYEDRVLSATELRMHLESKADLTENDFNRLTVSALRGSQLSVSYRSYEEMASSGVISNVADEELRKLLYQWDTILTSIKNADKGSEDVRSMVLFPILHNSISLGNAFKADERYDLFHSTKRFEFDIDAIRSDRAFDNAIATRLVMAKQQLDSLLDFIRMTEKLISTLESVGA